MIRIRNIDNIHYVNYHPNPQTLAGKGSEAGSDFA
jgi:hypothetical protein